MNELYCSSSSSSLTPSSRSATALIASKAGGNGSENGNQAVATLSSISQAPGTPKQAGFGESGSAASSSGISPCSLASDSLLTSAATENHKLSYGNGKAHHGSTTSTTFSTGSTLSSTTTNDPIDYSSTASSGVATMSSTDHIARPGQKSGCRHISTSHSSQEGDASLLLKLSTPQTTGSSTAAANSSSSTLSLNTAPASADSTLCSGGTNLVRSTPPCSSTNLSTPGDIDRSTSNKSVEGMYALHISSQFAADPDLNGHPQGQESLGAVSSKSISILPSCSISQTLPSLSASQNIPSGPSVFACGTSCSQIICTPLRTMVSQNRRRYQQDGFNLDLTYITDRIIAMGYPADTTEALYRNSMTHIVKFLEHYHPGHYKVFNLRGQYVYDTRHLTSKGMGKQFRSAGEETHVVLVHQFRGQGSIERKKTGNKWIRSDEKQQRTLNDTIGSYQN